ncbi:hypothetical protein F5Y15DRAFT_427743 [Xylariaceae sp. FL0016]|nr:hypothetical protein F5Y15DRAFT_427743 [Xylariaceae sp. FL0016]
MSSHLSIRIPAHTVSPPPSSSQFQVSELQLKVGALLHKVTSDAVSVSASASSNSSTNNSRSSSKSGQANDIDDILSTFDNNNNNNNNNNINNNSDNIEAPAPLDALTPDALASPISSSSPSSYLSIASLNPYAPAALEAIVGKTTPVREPQPQPQPNPPNSRPSPAADPPHQTLLAVPVPEPAPGSGSNSWRDHHHHDHPVEHHVLVPAPAVHPGIILRAARVESMRETQTRLARQLDAAHDAIRAEETAALKSLRDLIVVDEWR